MRCWVGFFIISIIPLNKFFYNNVILLVSLKMLRVYIIFAIYIYGGSILGIFNMCMCYE